MPSRLAKTLHHFTAMHRVALPLWIVTILSGPCFAGELQGTIHLPAGVDGRISPAVIYVATPDIAAPTAPVSAIVDQVNREFVPRVQAMVVGGTIAFRNSDNETHNVKSKADCCEFNYMLRRSEERRVGKECRL